MAVTCTCLGAGGLQQTPGAGSRLGALLLLLLLLCCLFCWSPSATRRPTIDDSCSQLRMFRQTERLPTNLV